MGFSIAYSLTEPVTPDNEAAIIETLHTLSDGRSWLSCEPPFLKNEEGALCGASTPNFTPHPEDVADAEAEGLPDGTLHDLLEILCRLSRQFHVDWQISHDFSDGPLGYIRNGEMDEEVREQCAALSDLAEDFGSEGFDLDDL